MSRPASDPVEHLDVLIIGAGLSGIGAAYYLQAKLPAKTYAIVESRGATGGTWDLFRYPGIRSDSDLHTFGYEFKPWRDDEAIARGDKILEYVREVAAENGIDRKVRFQRKVVGAAWSTERARWLVDVEHLDTGERSVITCGWIFTAGGYYNYDEAFSPVLTGRERFGGTIVHPQFWPEDLDYAGKRVVIIGSGATAVTLLPAMARTAAHVTMLQRTPSYIMPVPSKDAIANALRKVLSDERAYAITRRKNIAQQRLVWRFCQKYPTAARRLIRRINARLLPDGYPVDEHFNPPYGPWDQRLCAAPNGDFFKAIRNGTASVVTDRIETFTETGIRLTSGAELEADIIVTATGLKVQAMGGISISVDGALVRLHDTVAFKGMMLSGVPNFAYAIGYTNSSWTLKVGLLCEHFCRLLAYMDRHGWTACRPELDDPAMTTRPFLDFGAGYIQRAMDELPRQGSEAPWLTSTGYPDDVKWLREGPVADPHLIFTATASQPAASDETAVLA